MTRVKKAIVLALVLLALIGMGAVASTDTTPPEIAIFSPQNGATYTLNQPVTALWIVTDSQPSSGIAWTFATAPNGSLIDTATVGSRRFIVQAEDNAGNFASREIIYWVAYHAQAVDPIPQGDFGPEKIPQLTVKTGQAIPFSFALTDFFSNAVPTAMGTLTVLDAQTDAIVSIDKDIIGVLQYDSKAELYRYQLDTSSLAPGNYQIIVQFDDGLSTYRYALEVTASS